MNNKKNKWNIGIIGMAMIMIIISLIPYFYMFALNGFSDKTSDWANFGSYFGGITSGLNLILFYYITIKVSEIEDDRNKDNLIPLGDFSVTLSEKSIKIEYFNLGLGPMIITKLKIYDGNNEYSSFGEIKNIKRQGEFCYQSTILTDRKVIVSKNESIVLLDLSAENRNKVDQLRKEITNHRILLKYRDIYGRMIKEENITLKELGIDSDLIR